MDNMEEMDRFFSSVQSLSRVRLFETPWIAECQASFSITNSEFTQTHVHRVSDAIQPSHPLSSPSPPAPNPSQHQSLFQWVKSSHEVAKVLEFQLQHHSFQRNPRADLLQNGLVGSPCSPRDSPEPSPTPQFKNIKSSVLSLLYGPTLTSIHDHWKNHSLDQTDMFFWNYLAFFYYPMDVGHLISGSSAFSKSNLNIWKFSVHILLKPCLENFEHYSANIWDQCNCTVVLMFFGIAFLWDWNESQIWHL